MEGEETEEEGEEEERQASKSGCLAGLVLVWSVVSVAEGPHSSSQLHPQHHTVCMSFPRYRLLTIQPILPIQHRGRQCHLWNSLALRS